MNKFISDRIQELRSVTWPTKKQATTAAIAVLTIMLIIGFGLSFVDYSLNEAVLFFLNK
jgi:preprotein translocase SecE subunit